MKTIAPRMPLDECLRRLVSVAEKWVEGQVGNKEADKTSGDPRYLTPKEAAPILRHSVFTVQKWCREGSIRATKVGGSEVNGKGGKFLIPREEVDRYLRERTLIHGEKRRSAK